jgi:uncharacterized protein YjiS (DUF1127 family)
MQAVQTTQRIGLKVDFPGQVRHVVTAFAAAFSEWRRTRVEVLDLAHASDRLLSDIGLTRGEAMDLRSSNKLMPIVREKLGEAQTTNEKRIKKNYAYIDPEQCWY